MSTLVYRLELLEPVLIRQVAGGDPNSGVGYPYIPGSAIRGALIGRYAGKKDASADNFRRLFLDGGVRFLHAYPRLPGGQRMLPVPLSWQSRKDVDSPSVVYDTVFLTTPPANAQLKGVTMPFCAVQGAASGGKTNVTLGRPALQINIHTARANRQRTTADGATVFRYDSLAAGQTFVGAIESDNAGDIATLKTLIEAAPQLLLGGSHLAGYGLVTIAVMPDNQPFQEYEALDDDPDYITVVLLSDTIVRDPATGAAAADLRPIIDFAPIRVIAKTTIIGGFNRTWNLPLPQEWAIRGGSVFVYEPDDELLKTLRELEKTGIGERRAEGYGRIAVNWLGADQLAVQQSSSKTPDRITVPTTEREMAQQMVNRMLRDRMDRALPAAINKWQGKRNGLQNAQISALRLVVRRALTEGNLGVIPDYLAQMKKTGRDQVERARVGSQRLSTWLTARANNPGGIWTDLNITKYPTIGDVTAEKSNDLELEYTARLMDGVLRRFAKQEGL
ncbi:MAG: CRISPR-associated RAMP protein Csx10 [Anaerolineae bacterium]